MHDIINRMAEALDNQNLQKASNYVGKLMNKLNDKTEAYKLACNLKKFLTKAVKNNDTSNGTLWRSRLEAQKLAELTETK